MSATQRSVTDLDSDQKTRGKGNLNVNVRHCVRPSASTCIQFGALFVLNLLPGFILSIVEKGFVIKMFKIKSVVLFL